MSGNTFVSSRIDLIENRFNEINTLLNLAKDHYNNPSLYSTLCRSAHVLLVSHVEGIYKDIVRDVIDDLNRNTDFFVLKKTVFRTHAQYYIQHDESEKSKEVIKDRLWSAFINQKTSLILEPFLRVDNKNPTPKILEEILKKFGENSFFSYLVGSRLEIVFENNILASLKELSRIKKYLIKGVQEFPYTVDKSFFYNYSAPKLKKEQKGLFEELLNDFLSDRHKIIHGQTLNNPKNHTEIEESKIKIEVLIYAFIITLCHGSNPVITI